MKKLLIFAAFILALGILFSVPFTGFDIVDRSIYNVQLPRTIKGDALSAKGLELPFVKSMYNRVYLYGDRFLSWTPSKLSMQEIFDLAIQKVFESKLISSDDMYLLLKELASDTQQAWCDTDAMGYYNIHVVMQGTSVEGYTLENVFTTDIYVEIESSTGLMYNLNFPSQTVQKLSAQAYVKYLQLETLDDWQYFKDDSVAYSQNGQLYVYAQQQQNNDLRYSVKHMTKKEFADLETSLKQS